MSSEIIICAENIGKCYQIYDRPIDRLKQSLWRGRKQFFKEFWALKNVSLKIKKNETVGVIGSNGSGKSTLLQIVCGILSPTEGKLKVNGRIAALLELGSGFNPEYTGRENIYMNASIMGLSKAEMDSRYEEVVAFADIGGFIDQPVKMYSSGMYVRLAFAAAVNVSPDILVVDEALSVGDARFQQKCMDKIRNFCKTGTVIFVSHDTAAVTELCSRVFWIESGKIRLDGTPKFVTEKYLQYMYEGDDLGENVSVTPSRSFAGVSSIGDFSPVCKDLRQFGDRRAIIEAVSLSSHLSSNGIVYSGRPCEITMAFYAHKDITNPVIGFMVKDRLGREIFADNTALIRQDIERLSAGGRYIVRFVIDEWPNLREEEYTLTVALADGTMDDHAQCHYVHDVVIFTSIPVRKPGGIISVPNTDVNLFQMDGKDAPEFT